MFAVESHPDLLPLAQQSLSRVDLYRPIHKALRLYMFDVLRALGSLDPDDPQELDVIMMRTARLLDQFAAHLAHENAFLHPVIAGLGGEEASVTAREHDEHCRAIAALRERVRDLSTCPARARHAFVSCIYRELALFIADNLRHMQIEEAENNAALWQLLDDGGLHALHAELLAHVKPESLEDILPWMVRALNPQELADLYQGMRANAPLPNFHAALELAQSTLDAASFGKLMRAISLHPQTLAA